MAFRILDSINNVSRRALEGGQTEGENDTKIYVLDINPNMLAVGKRRAADKSILVKKYFNILIF